LFSIYYAAAAQATALAHGDGAPRAARDATRAGGGSFVRNCGLRRMGTVKVSFLQRRNIDRSAREAKTEG